MDFNSNNNNMNQNENPYGYGYVPPAKLPGNAFASAAMVLGIISIVSALLMTVYFPFIFGSLAILFALLSRGRAAKLSNPAKAGICCGSVGFGINLAIIISSFALILSNPELLMQTAQTYDEMCEQIYGVPTEDILGESMEDIMGSFVDSIQ